MSEESISSFEDNANDVLPDVRRVRLSQKTIPDKIVGGAPAGTPPVAGGARVKQKKKKNRNGRGQ